MFKSKYSTVLTIILIILIIAIIIIATVLAIGAYKNYQEEKERNNIYTTLQENTSIDKPEQNNNTVDDEELLKPIDTNTSRVNKYNRWRWTRNKKTNKIL